MISRDYKENSTVEIRELVLRLLFHEQKNMLTVLVGRAALASDKLQDVPSSNDSTPPHSSLMFSHDSHRITLQYSQEMSRLNDRCRKLLLDHAETWKQQEWLELLTWWCSKLSLEFSNYLKLCDQMKLESFQSQLSQLKVEPLTSAQLLSFLSSVHGCCSVAQTQNEFYILSSDTGLTMQTH